MTAPATTIPPLSQPQKQQPATGDGLPDPGTLFALPGDGVPFAELLSTLGNAGSGASAQGAAVAASPSSAAASKGTPDKKEAKGEEDKKSKEKGDDGASAGIAAGIPLTINTLNSLLLRGDGAKQETPLHESAPADGRAGTKAGACEKLEGDDSPAPEGKGENKPGNAGAAAPIVKEAAPSPLGALAKAGEAAQASVQGSKPGAGSEAKTANAPEGKEPGIQATGALTKAAVAAPAQAAAIREVKPGATGASTTIAGVNGGAQGTRGGARALRTSDAPGPQAGAEARRAAFQAQLARGVATAVEKGGGTLTLRLKPEALGHVQVKVSMKDGVVSAHFEAQTSEARDLLLASTGDLRRSLEAAGVSVERVEASVSPHLNDPAPGTSVFAGLQADTGSAGGGGDGGGTPGRNDSGPQSRRRGTDAALLDGTDDAAEPRVQSSGWLVLGLDTIA